MIYCTDQQKKLSNRTAFCVLHYLFNFLRINAGISSSSSGWSEVVEDVLLSGSSNTERSGVLNDGTCTGVAGSGTGDPITGD